MASVLLNRQRFLASAKIFRRPRRFHVPPINAGFARHSNTAHVRGPWCDIDDQIQACAHQLPHLPVLRWQLLPLTLIQSWSGSNRFYLPGALLDGARRDDY